MSRRRRSRRRGTEARAQAEPRWIDHHVRSERQASRAWLAAQSRDRTTSVRLYARAAAAEKQALNLLPGGRPRTYSILAVSAASLYMKALDYESCRSVIATALRFDGLEPWAARQLGLIEYRVGNAPSETT